METFDTIKPLLAVLVSLAAAGLIVVTGERHRNLRETWTILAAFAKFGLVASMLPAVLAGARPELGMFQLSPGVSLALRVDEPGILFALSASFLWIVTSFYAIGYMRGLKEHKQTRFFASLALCLSATIGIAFSANLLTLVVFYEILTVATYPLVIHKEDREAIASGRKYLVYLLTGGMALIPAAGVTLALAGTLDFTPGGFLSMEMGRGPLLGAFLLFLLGFGVKAGVMPLHSWLPAAMVAPTPVSALLHAVAVVKAGVFGMVRVVGYVFGPEAFQASGAASILMAMAATTILLASLIALRQDNLKLRLAYSTVGHLSYILLGLAVLTPSSLIGGVYHMAAHGAMKITLFFCAGAIYVRTKRTQVSQLDGIGKQMPFTMAAFGLASLGMAGMPLVAGFVSKWYLVQGMGEAGRAILLALLVLSGLLSAGYLWPIVARAFVIRAPSFARLGEASVLVVAPLVVTAVLALGLGVFPDAVFRFFWLSTEIASSILNGGIR